MRLILLFLSNIAVLLAIASTDQGSNQESSGRTKRYGFVIDYGNSAITGTLIVKDTDEAIYGSMINEFGISAIDFSYLKKKEKLKLHNVVSFLDRWYIKRVLRKDITRCLHLIYDIPSKVNRHYDIEQSGDTITLLNVNRNLRYTLTPFKDYNENHDTEE